ncbi:MAG: acyl-CoA dehydrogenase family protein, partial [Acetobacteraceae bacterium]|nr:acyl-CoA dehydrogenase family protein [Acetobacteraceae bacterium]
MDAPTAEDSHRFGFDADLLAVRDMARSFGAERLKPNAVAWDQDKHFPVEEIREAAALGMCGIYVREDAGGSGLSRLAAAVIVESLSEGCPSTAAYISIHNMVAGMVDLYGDERQRGQ